MLRVQFNSISCEYGILHYNKMVCTVKTFLIVQRNYQEHFHVYPASSKSFVVSLVWKFEKACSVFVNPKGKDSGILECGSVSLTSCFLIFWRNWIQFKCSEPLTQWHRITFQKTRTLDYITVTMSQVSQSQRHHSISAYRKNFWNHTCGETTSYVSKEVSFLHHTYYTFSWKSTKTILSWGIPVVCVT